MEFGKYIKNYGNVKSFYYNEKEQTFVYICEWRNDSGHIVEHRYFKEKLHTQA